MIFVEQTIGVDKVGAGAAKLPGFVVHHLRKSFQRTVANLIGEHDSSLVGRGQHDGVQQLFDGQRFIEHNAAGRNTAAVGNVDFINIVLQLGGKGQLLTQVGEMLEGEDGGHNLGQ